jgi:phage FluMu protein gp41
MSTDTTTHLYDLTLITGLPVVREGKTIYYRKVKLREVDVVDERWAVRQAERLVLWQEQPRLVISDADHRLALTARHIEAFECDGMQIGTDLIDLSLIERLKPYDLAAIEERVFLIEMAIKVRIGQISQGDFNKITGAGQEAVAPQPVGPAADTGAAAPVGEPGPVMLADHSGAGASVQAGSLGR